MARPPVRLLALVALLLAALPIPATSQESGRGIAVIVHPQRGAQISADELAQIYLRRRRHWADGSTIVPLNLPADSPLRHQFVRQVLRQQESRLADYWNRRYFDGVFPPSTLASVPAVLRYVASDRNAVGYVPESAADESVRVIFRFE